MTPEDKARIEEIREIYALNESPQAKDVNEVLAQLDETSSRLASAHAALRFYGDVLQVRCRMKEHDNGERARKALDGSTDPDTGTKGSLGEE